MKNNILIFSYYGNHKKSEDLLSISKKENLNIKIALLSPWKAIKKKNKFKGFRSIIKPSSAPVSKLLDSLGYNYLKCEHDDQKKIKKIIKKYNINLGIVFGARIIKKNIIDLFDNGIINYHPGSLPATSGLDSFYWMINKNIGPVVTSHFIDKRIDAGLRILEKKIDLQENDNMSIVEEKLYKCQLDIHKKICKLINKKKLIKISNINNYSKNKPMTINQKKLTLKKFESWKKIFTK